MGTVLKGIGVFNLEQDSRMKRDFCLKQSQVLKALTEHFYPDFSRDPPSPPPGSVPSMLSTTTLPIAINNLLAVLSAN